MQRLFVTRRACALFLAVCLGLVSRVNAQSATQGAVGGTIFDTNGAAIPNAPVSIVNDGTGAQFQVQSDGSGYFKAPLLEPGTYTISIAAAGFAPFRESNVIVQVSQMTNLEPHLSVASSNSTVEVSGEAPVLDFDSPDFISTLNKTALDSIPINNRRWSSLAMTTPGVV
jgi:hypothetical protein